MKQRSNFEPKRFLTTIAEGRTIVSFPKRRRIHAQGTPCNAVFYIQKGKVKLSVTSKLGKQAAICILDEADFFGEACLTGQQLHMTSATALEQCSLMKIDVEALRDVLGREPAFSDTFVTYLLTRSIRYKEDLVDQLFNSSEKRLARILLLLAKFGKEGVPETVIPEIIHETLAEMVGTTRSRVNVFMNRFRKLGFIHYNDRIQVHSSLLSIVLNDESVSPGQCRKAFPC